MFAFTISYVTSLFAPLLGMGLFYFDLRYLLIISPAILLAFWAQFRLQSAYSQASRRPAPLSGAAAARHILDSAGLQNVQIEPIGGRLSDHYDPRHKVLRLSQDVYGGRSLASVGIAAHEAGHAIQDARNYSLLVIRNAAVPAANIGSSLSFILIIAGIIISSMPILLWAGIALFSGVVFFQVVNLPVEYNASARAKDQLLSLGIISNQDMPYVRKVLGAAALTYVAATLQAILTLLYYIMVASNRR